MEEFDLIWLASVMCALPMNTNIAEVISRSGLLEDECRCLDGEVESRHPLAILIATHLVNSGLPSDLVKRCYSQTAINTAQARRVLENMRLHRYIVSSAAE